MIKNKLTSLNAWEKSPQDAKMDKKSKLKEGTKAEQAADRSAMAKYAKSKKK